MRYVFITMALLVCCFLKPTTVFAMDWLTDLVNLGAGYHICSDFTDYGVCKDCGIKFELENRTTLNCKAKALKQEGAIHVEPYGMGTINGRLVKNAWYTVAESATNAFGKTWYRLEGMDTKRQELWVVSSYLELHESCTEYDTLGYCKSCKQEFAIQNVQNVNRWMEATKNNGALHDRPYGGASINGRLNEGQNYYVVQSGLNSAGNLWYLITDTDGVNKWVVWDYLKETNYQGPSEQIHDYCTEYDDLGYCKVCKKEFYLQNVQGVNRWMEARKENGALHDRPYGEANVNGRLVPGQHYYVVQSGLNSAGNLWYLITDTDGINKWVVWDYLKEIFNPVEQQGTWQYAAPKNMPLLSGIQAEDVAQIAYSQLGYRQEHGAGTVYGAWWSGVTNWGDYTNSDWCAMFACWCADQAGAGLYKAFNKSSARVIELFNYVKNNGFCDTTFQTEPRPGDFIFFKNGNATLTLPHVAVIVGYNRDTREITYVGGNQWLNNSCRSAVTLGTCKWEAGAKPKGEKLYVYGYGRPAYSNSEVLSTSTNLVPLLTSDKTVYNVGENVVLQRNGVQYANYYQLVLYQDGNQIYSTPMNEVIHVLSNLQPGNYNIYLQVGNALSSGTGVYYFTVVDSGTEDIGGDFAGIEDPIVNPPVEKTSTITVTATGAGNITSYNATVYGNAYYTGNRPSEVGLQFGENPDSLIWVAGEPINFSKNPFDIWYDLEKEAHLTLTPGKIYYYRLYAIVDGEVSYSNVVSFTTPATVSVWTSGVSNVTGTNATVHGGVQYTGNRTSEVGLQFGESPDSLIWVAGEPTNFSKNPYDVWYDLNKEANIWLSPGKTYFYRFYAIQDGNTTFSDIASFTN